MPFDINIGKSYAFSDISDYDSRVELDDVNIDWISWDVTSSTDKLTPEFRVEIPGTLATLPVQNVSNIAILRGWSGGLQTLVKKSNTIGPDASGNCLSYERHVNQEGVTFSISGRGEVYGVSLTKSPAKDLYFLATTWLDKLYPGNWTIDSGYLKTKALNFDGYILPGNFIYPPELPGPNIARNTYEIILTCPTHRSIATYLAQDCGLALVMNVPSLTVKRYFKAPSGTSYFQSLQNLLSIWNPDYELKEDNRTGVPTLYVLDVGGDEQALQSFGRFKLSTRHFEAYVTKLQALDKSRVVNHVIVKGAKDVQTTIRISDNDQNTSAAAEVPLSEDTSITYQPSYQRVFAKKEMGEFLQGFNYADAPDRKIPENTILTTYYHIDEKDKGKWIPVREVAETYASGQLMSMKETTHKYSKAYKPVGSIEELWNYVQTPGMPDKEWKKVSRRIVDQNQDGSAVNASSCIECTEGLVLVDSARRASDNKKYYVAPIDIVSATQQGLVSKNPATRQEILEMTLKTMTKVINRVNEHVLIQWQTEYDCLSETEKTRMDVLANPDKSVSSSNQESQFVEEFKYGAGPYHPAVTIEHLDIGTHTEAKQVADRISARSGLPKIEVNLDMIVPLPVSVPGFFLEIPTCVAEVRDGTTAWREVQIPGGQYRCATISERANKITGETAQTLTLRNVI
jgi:hypothetical protein